MSPSSAAERTCTHCGTRFRPSPPDRQFCCAGCEYVAGLIASSGLGAYYKFKDGVTAPVGNAALGPRDWTWLESARDAAERDAAAGTASLVLDVQGMSCIGCVWLIERVFQREPGGVRLDIDIQLGRARLRWKPGVFDVPGFARRLQGFGYLLGPPGEKTGGGETNLLAWRTGLAAALMLNVMLFTLPTYLGMEATWLYARLFGWISLSLATVSLLACGGYFIRRAVDALRVGALHIDLPISLGLVAGYAASVYGFATGDERLVYFDFVATFVFLMLAGRWTQVWAVERNRNRILGLQTQPDAVTVLDPATRARASRGLDALAPGDLFLLPPGRLCPVESTLVTPVASVTTECINGEAEPRLLRAGQPVPSGAANAGSTPLELEAREPWSRSLLRRLTTPRDAAELRNPLVERVVGIYLPAVLVAAAGGFAGWLGLGATLPDALAVAVAVLVVSCPCGIGVAAPLADELAGALLRRHGVFLRRLSLWPALRAVRRVVFDKTGTLTLENPRPLNPAALDTLDEPARAALLRLVADNPHPASRAIHEALLERGVRDPAAFAVAEDIGLGVSGRDASGVLWTLGRPGWDGVATGPADGGADVEFRRDGAPLARLRLAEELRPDAAAEVARLRDRGLAVFILSGDRREKVDTIAAALGLDPGASLAGLRPEEKAAWVADRDRGDTLMLGDGANDGLAFDRAAVRGTPVVHRGLLEHRADFYWLGRGIAGVRILLETAAFRRRVVAGVFTFTTLYNAAAVAAALLGLIHPLLAAILMPVSSLVSLALVALPFARRLAAAQRTIA